MPKISRVGKFRAAAALANAEAKRARPVGNVSRAAGEREKNDVTESKSIRGTIKDNKDDDRNATRPNAETTGLSRGQRKRLAKREQYMRREQMVLQSLKLQRQDEQKKRIDGLDALRDALDAAAAKSDKEKQPVAPQKSLLKSNRGRRILVQREAKHMKLVLEHPAFVNDPLAAIREHLENTLATDVAEQKGQEKERIEAQLRHQQEKKAAKREQQHERKNNNKTSGSKKWKKCKATKSRKK